MESNLCKVKQLKATRDFFILKINKNKLKILPLNKIIKPQNIEYEQQIICYTYSDEVKHLTILQKSGIVRLKKIELSGQFRKILISPNNQKYILDERENIPQKIQFKDNILAIYKVGEIKIVKFTSNGPILIKRIYVSPQVSIAYLNFTNDYFGLGAYVTNNNQLILFDMPLEVQYRYLKNQGKVVFLSIFKINNHDWRLVMMIIIKNIFTVEVYNFFNLALITKRNIKKSYLDQVIIKQLYANQIIIVAFPNELQNFTDFYILDFINPDYIKINQYGQSFIVYDFQCKKYQNYVVCSIVQSKKQALDISKYEMNQYKFILNDMTAGKIPINGIYDVKGSWAKSLIYKLTNQTLYSKFVFKQQTSLLKPFNLSLISQYEQQKTQQHDFLLNEMIGLQQGKDSKEKNENSIQHNLLQSFNKLQKISEKIKDIPLQSIKMIKFNEIEQELQRHIQNKMEQFIESIQQICIPKSQKISNNNLNHYKQQNKYLDFNNLLKQIDNIKKQEQIIQPQVIQPNQTSLQEIEYYKPKLEQLFQNLLQTIQLQKHKLI